MGSRADTYVHPAIEHLLQMDQQETIKLAESQSFEEAVAVFSDFLARSKVVKSCVLDKIEDDKYVFKVVGCVWAGKVHDRQVSLKDVTCPYALVAMALYKKFKGFISRETESEYFYNGTQTTLEPIYNLEKSFNSVYALFIRITAIIS